MAGGRTIDNLGIDASTQYAENLQNYDASLVREGRAISLDVGIEVSTPSFSPELEGLLHLQPSGISWASFPPPEGYLEQRGRLFSSQLIPSMGSEEKQEAQTQKISAKTTLLEEEQREKKVLTSLFEGIAKCDKMIDEIISNRERFQKG